MYNKSEIMKTAWRRTKAAMGYRDSIEAARRIFAEELHYAWMEAKEAVAIAAAPVDPKAALKFELVCIAHKNHITPKLYQRINFLRQQIAA